MSELGYSGYSRHDSSPQETEVDEFVTWKGWKDILLDSFELEAYRHLVS